MLELKELRTFREVARTLNFTRAAEHLSYAQSAVTTQIQSLERELGQPLFRRLGRRVELTAAGEKLESYAARMVELAEEAVNALREEEATETLRVGTAESLCTYRLPPIVQALRKRHPRASVYVEVEECGVVRNGIQSCRYDIGLFIDEPKDYAGFRTHNFGEVELVLIAPKGHRLEDRANVRPADLVRETILVLEPTCAYRTLFEAFLARAGRRASVVSEFNSIEAVKQCVAAGIGIGLLPRFTIERELLDGKYAILPINLRGNVATLLAYREDKWLSPALSTFIECSATGLVV
ncbi:MAG TPA: LysR family transcriptional regulator [Candidatus Baltobacteraceae bacterium]